MKFRKSILYLLLNAVVLFSLYCVSAYAAPSTAGSPASAYGGKWVDKALVEDEDSDGTLNLTVNQQTGKAKLAYDVWDGGETYTFQSATLLTIDGQQPVKFTYKYKVYNGDGEERSASGEGSIQFKPGLIVLQMGQLPSEVDPIFTKPRSFIRDPYGNRAPKPGADFDIVAKYCNCKPSKLVKFDYPAGDNESNKEWIRYVSVYVRDIFITEYKVNLHTNTAINLKDSWSEAYQTHNQIQTSKITATSTLPKSKTSSYSPNQVMDGDSTTCWCEGVKGSGIGQSFTIQFTKTIEIEGLKILPGYGKSVSAYLENNSVRKARITFSDGSSTIVDFTKGYYFELPEIKRTNSIKFTILEVNPGSKYDDTCVTELAVF